MSSSRSERLVTTSLPILELIKLINNSPHEQRDFSEVKNILIERENGMEMEIENLRRDRDSVKREVCLLERTVNLSELERSELEEKLYKKQRKCDKLEETVTRLIEEKRLSDDREKRAEERCVKISAENSKTTNAKNKLIFGLMERIDELKNKNLENERLVGIYQEKYKCSDTMVVKMRQEVEDLRSEKLAAVKTVEDLRQKQLECGRVVEELKRDNFEANKTIDELRLKKSESDKLAALYKSRLKNLWSRIKEEADMMTVKMGDLANLVNDVRKLANFEEGKKLDFSDGAENIAVLSPGVRSASNSTRNESSGSSMKGDRNVAQSCTREDDARVSHSGCNPQAESDECNEPLDSVAHASGVRLMSGEGCFNEITCSSFATGDIVEILDSDNDVNPDGEADMSNRAVGLNVCDNEMNFVHWPSSSTRSNQNQRYSIEGFCANLTTKRKRKMCTNSEDSISIHEEESEVLKSTHDRIDCSSSRKCGEEAGPDRYSQTPLEKFNGLNYEFQWAWKREALQTMKLTVKLTSQRAIIGQIAKELKLIGAEVYEELTNSCFGFLMRLDTHQCRSKAVLHYLFAHEVVKSDAGPDELWYRVGGRFIRFSKYEYALVTGLSFGPTSFDPSAKHDPPASGLFLRHYQGRRLKMYTLRHNFMNGVFRHSPADAIKVAKLLLVYYLLNGMDGSHKYIDKWAWALIEDTDRWETFIWGKYTYQILLRYLQQVPTELPHSKTRSYNLYGYVWAFLIWAYEAIPELGATCGGPTVDDALPRCLRWRFSKPQVDIDRFFDREMEVCPTLEPSAEERKQPYWEHIHDDLQSGVCYVRQNNPLKKKTTTVSPSDLDVPPGFTPHRSRATPTRRSAAPLARKRQRAEPPRKKITRHLARG